MTADDLLARIDGAAEQWDTWDGRSADAARWWPDDEAPPVLAPAELRDAFDLAFAAVADAFAQAYTRIADVIWPAVEAVAEIEQAQQQRAKHEPPMWAVQPNRERRR